jgi:hypothetical protein
VRAWWQRHVKVIKKAPLSNLLQMVDKKKSGFTAYVKATTLAAAALYHVRTQTFSSYD